MAAKKNSTTAKKEAPETVETSPTADSVEATLTLEERLAGIPDLIPPHRLRVKHRNKIRSIFLNLERKGVFESEGVEIREDRIEDFMAVIEDVDEFAESIAYDHEAYVDWASDNGNNVDAFAAILEHYMAALGE